jgi:hypothetical protein
VRCTRRKFKWSNVSEVMGRKFERSKCLRGYKKKLQEEHMSQRLGEGNSRGTGVSEVRRKKF